jgi:hypothetical protein
MSIVKEENIEELKESGLSFLNVQNLELDNSKIDSGLKPLRHLLPQKHNSVIQKNSQILLQISSNRTWKTIYNSYSLNNETAISKIEIKTRSDQPSLDSMSERLYSSLKYEVSQEIPFNYYGSAVIMCKIDVVNPFESDEVITKQGGNDILKGNTELIPLTLNSKKTLLSSKTKIQFLSVSFHHENKYFSFKFSYYHPENLNNPILVQLSAPFQVFARR